VVKPSPSFVVKVGASFIDYPWVIQQMSDREYSGGWLTKQQIIDALHQSLCFGLYTTEVMTSGEELVESGRQIGFARVVTDRHIFSALCDIFISEKWRGQGLGSRLLAEVLAHPHVAHTICVLETKSAMGFYEKQGFSPVSFGIMKRHLR
jgi:GNAT superfamily N-acetyltransferase